MMWREFVQLLKGLGYEVSPNHYPPTYYTIFGFSQGSEGSGHPRQYGERELRRWIAYHRFQETAGNVRGGTTKRKLVRDVVLKASEDRNDIWMIDGKLAVLTPDIAGRLVEHGHVVSKVKVEVS